VHRRPPSARGNYSSGNYSSPNTGLSLSGMAANDATGSTNSNDTTTVGGNGMFGHI
jgi:hypothetical protein